jgi:hypothetical protein
MLCLECITDGVPHAVPFVCDQQLQNVMGSPQDKLAGAQAELFLRDLDVGAPSVSIVWGLRRMARLGPARSECLCSRPALVGVGVSRMCCVA